MYNENLFGNFYLPACALVYMSLLALMFFSKKKLKTIDNELYARLITLNIFGDILLIFCIYFLIYDPNNILLIIFKKIYLVYMVDLTFTCTIYMINLAYDQNSIEKRQEIYNKAKKIRFIVLVFTALIHLVAPSYFILNEKMIFQSGDFGLWFDYAVCFFIEVWWVGIYIKTRKSIAFYKRIAIFVTSLVVYFVAIVEFLTSANILAIDIGTVFAIYALYLTVFITDNPDMKMVEEIKKSRNEAESSNESTSEFLEYISKEIRNPLSTIVGFSEALKQEELDGEAKEIVGDISSVSDSLVNIVNGITDASKNTTITNEENKEKESI